MPDNKQRIWRCRVDLFSLGFDLLSDHKFVFSVMKQDVSLTQQFSAKVVS